MTKLDIAVAYGDGIGPEIMNATLAILDAAGANLTIHEVAVGEKVYLSGHKSGIEAAGWDTLRKCKIFLKAPITTPQGGGYRSLNVTIRAAFGLYANVRPAVAYAPSVATRHPGMNIVIVRENEEDLYTGLEYRPTNDSYHAYKMNTREGCEKIIRYAFEYAKANGRKKVTCFTKDNILKMTDGLFHKTFDEIAKQYPDLINEHWIIDIGAAKMADAPEQFDVIVLPNLYGDILSDVAAEIAGSVGLAGSANIGDNFAMFEAIHGSAPKRAGQNVANPSGLLLGAIMMLVHAGKTDTAACIHNAWLKTLEDGIHTYDIYTEETSKKRVGTKEFAQAIIERLGKTPKLLPPVHYEKKPTHKSLQKPKTLAEKKELVGIDVFIDTQEQPGAIAKKIGSSDPFVLEEIASRGAIIWPKMHPETAVGDLLRLRFMAKTCVSLSEAIYLLKKLESAKIAITGHEALFTYDQKPGFSRTTVE